MASINVWRGLTLEVQHPAYAPQPNRLVKPTPTSSACWYPPHFVLRCGLPRALGLNKKVMCDMEEDWRLGLANTPAFYKQFKWKFKRWSQTRPGWDHDHCEFCQVKIMDEPSPENLAEGWATTDETYWICQECFNDFQGTYHWQIDS